MSSNHTETVVTCLVKAGLFAALYLRYQDDVDATVAAEPMKVLMIGFCFPVYTVMWMIPQVWNGICSLVPDTFGDVIDTAVATGAIGCFGIHHHFNKIIIIIPTIVRYFAQIMKMIQVYGLWTVLPGMDLALPLGDQLQLFVANTKAHAESDIQLWLVGLVLFILGQYLSVYAVNTALGMDGVYYGIRYGRIPPWCTIFPYNKWWLKDPQYVGAIMTIAGLQMIVNFPFIWTVITTLFYVWMGLMETREWTPRAILPKGLKTA